MISRLIQHLDHFVLRQAPPHALALFRLIFGSFLLFYWSTFVPAVPMLFSNKGITLPHFDRALPDPLLILLSPPPLPIAWLLYVTLLLSFLLIASGLSTTIGSGIAFLLHLYYWFAVDLTTWTTIEHISTLLLIFLMFSGADKTYSLTTWWKYKSFTAWEPISILPQRLIAFQLTATFLGVEFLKLVRPGWQGGEIFSYSLIGMWSTPFAFSLARLNLPIEIYDALVYGVKLFQFCLPFGLWIPKQRIWWIGGLTLFLLGVTSLYFFWWFLILVPTCITLYEPEEVKNRMEKILASVKRKRKNPRASLRA